MEQQTITQLPSDEALAEVERLLKLGYRRVSHKYRTVARIDRPDWQNHLIQMGHSNMLYSEHSAADWYRRCVSKDKVDLPYAIYGDAFKLIPGSSGDNTGFVHQDGTPDPGYEIRLVRRETFPSTDVRYKFSCDCSYCYAFICPEDLSPHIPPYALASLEGICWMVNVYGHVSSRMNNRPWPQVLNFDYFSILAQNYAQQLISKRAVVWCNKCGQEIGIEREQ
jgi:hypothetical protein